MNIVDLSIKRPIMVAMGLIACVIFGLMAYFTLPVSLFPDIKVPMVTVQTVYPGASPQIIESQISKKIEDRVSAISGIDYVTSYSLENASLVLVSFKYGIDENLALQEVKDKVDAIQAELPDDAKKPSISKIDISAMSPVMSIVIEGEMAPTELHTFAQTVVNDRLSQVDGVGSIELSGGQEREIRVELDRATVFSRSVPIEQIAGILAASNVDMPGGNFNLADQDIPVRLKGEFVDLDQIRDIDVKSPAGVYKLRQLADVRDAGTAVRQRTVLADKAAGLRNENALLVQVVKNPSSNTISVVAGVNAQLKKIREAYGGKVRFNVIKEDASFVKDSVDDTLSNVYLGILFTGIVLLFFLHDLRSTLIVALSMPFSIVSTFLVMKAMGISVSMISLMGLSCSTGTLVANSVVVLENIFRYKELGHGRTESASRGTKEVLVAVFASTLTNIAVFVPLASMSGMMGAVLANFAWPIVIATVFSIVVSFTLTPLMASFVLPATVKKEGRLSLGLERLFKGMEEGYRRMLAALLKKRRRSALAVVSVVAVFAGSMALFPRIPIELTPKTDGGKIKISVELPQGSDLESTAAALAEIEKRVGEYEEVSTLLTNLGTLGSLDTDVSVAQMDVFLVPKAARAASNAELASRMTVKLSDIPGAQIRVAAVSEIDMGGRSAISLFLKGADNDILRDQSSRIVDRLNRIPGFTNVASSSKSGKPELVFEPDRKRLSEDGLSVQSVAVSLRAAVDGLVATTYKEGGEEYDIRVALKDAALLDVQDLRNIPIVSSAGVHPLSRYAKIDFAEGYNKIIRNNKVRSVELTADLLPGYAQGAAVQAALAAVAELDLPAGYAVEQSSSTEMLQKTVQDLAMVFVIAVVLTFMLLAATLESLSQPLFILATVPLSLIGVVAFCLPLGTVLNFVAMLGIIMLVGIVVNNAILMLDYYNQLKREGRSPHDALIEACPTKLKPILMSNIAIVLGMLPMAMGIGASGAEMRQPMGVVIIGGIVVSTALTLFLIPALEYLLARAKEGGARNGPAPIPTLTEAEAAALKEY